MWAVWLIVEVLLVIGGVGVFLEVVTLLFCRCTWCNGRRDRLRKFFRRPA